jgi:hypothetical protein
MDLRKVTEIMHTRTFQVSAFLLILFALICTRIPLLNYLGYEFSALTVLLASYLSGIGTLSEWKRTIPERASDVWQCIGRSISASVVLLLIPFLIALGNALFVKNCSIGDGVVLYALTVIPGVFFSTTLALMLGVLFRRRRKIIFTGIYILILLHIPYVTIILPQVFAFNPIMGFFPGFTYDETLQITQRLLIYRMAILAAAGCLASGTVWLWSVRKNKTLDVPSKPSSTPVVELITIAILAPVVVIVFSFSNRFGLSSSESFIRQKLAGNYTTAHFEIIYSAGSVKREYIEQIGVLHEFYYAKLCREMKLHSEERILSFLYASPEQKGRLIGAVHTDLSKPWLRQMHINLADVESVLKHEMVHVLAGEFGWSPLKIAPNSGLVEGLAMAMGQTSMIEEPLNRAAAMVVASGDHPDLESLFSFSGFMRANPSISYTLAGSFCQFLIESFGIDPFKRLYAGGSYIEIYQHDLPSLLGMWRASFMRIPLNNADSMKAVYYFRRPSIFAKECARVIANRNAETRELLVRQEYEKAYASAEQSLRLSKTPEAVMQKATALFEMHKFHEFVEYVTAQLGDSTIAIALAPLHLRLGDAYWVQDSFSRAQQEYEILSRMQLNNPTMELCALRSEALTDQQERNDLRIFFTYVQDDTTRIARLEKLKHPVARYLLGRLYAGKERLAESAQIFESIEPFKSKTLEFFRLFRLGKIWFQLQNFEKAKSIFLLAQQTSPNLYLQLTTIEWQERCDFSNSR